MDIRLFQIVVPIIIISYMVYELKKVYDHKKGWIDIIPSMILLCSIVIVAILPDYSTKKLANLLGFKSNVNAVLFSLIGILCLFVLRLFDRLRGLQKDITKLSIEYALLKEKVD